MKFIVIGTGYVGLVTEWQEFIQTDWRANKERMKEPYVSIDGLNTLAQDKSKALGYKYVGIGRKIS